MGHNRKIINLNLYVEKTYEHQNIIKENARNHYIFTPDLFALGMDALHRRINTIEIDFMDKNVSKPIATIIYTQ